MDAKRWQQVDVLLQSALLLSADQQEEFLRHACGKDTALWKEVSSLLTSHRDAGTFLEQPPIDAATQTAALPAITTTAASFTGQIISHYRVLGPLGSGGMGIVYRAVDIKLERGVALKFLPSGLATNPVAFERLQREARAASGLDHPNICSIYELGEHGGQPFIAMQLLEGQTLREWIEADQQQIPARLSKVLNFAIQIANGLEAAHQRGIIHRDIKPANIFITSRGDAKILDFGLAKQLVEESTAAPIFIHTASDTATADISDTSTPANLTRTGATMGTAHYMSPEQVRGEKLDARTDLFSLGLVLYEMVTGHRAYPGETGAAVYEAILHREPMPVRQLKPDVPSELERIITHAIAKDRSLRYGSAKDLSADLENLRAGSRSTVDTRNRKWMAAGLLFIILAASIGVLIQHSARTGSHENPPVVKLRRSVAVLGFRNLAGNSKDAWISTALAEMVSTELASGQQLRIIPGENVAHMFLDLALPDAVGYGPETLKKIRKSLGTDIVVQGSYLVSPGQNLRIDLQLQDADTGETIGTVSENGKDDQIAALVSRADASLREQLGIGAIPADDLHKASAVLPVDPQAVRLYSEGLAKLRVFDALAARDLLIRAIAVEPTHAMSHSLLAQSLSVLGYDAQAATEAKKAFELSTTLPRDNQLLIEGRDRELSNDFPAAIETYRTLWKFFPDNLEYGLKLADAQTKNSAPKDSMVTIAQLRKLPEPDGYDPRIDLAEANASDSMGDFKRTQQVASAAAEKAKRLGNRLQEGQAKEREGWAWDRLGESDKAMSAFSESHDLELAGGNLLAAARALNGEANALYDKGDLEGARKFYEDTLRVARQIGAQRSIAVASNNLGNVLYDQGKLEEARRYYQSGLEIDRLTDNKRGIASDLGSLGNVLEGMGDLPAATRMQEQALQAFRDVGDRRGEASTLNNLGNVLSDRGELAPAKQRFEEAMAVQQQIGYRRGRGFSLFGIADILLAQDKVTEARATTLEAIALRQELKDESATAESQMQLARIALEQGNASEAEGLARGAAKEFDQQKAADNACSSNAILGKALLAQEKITEAQTVTDLALGLCQRGQDRGAEFLANTASAAVKFKIGESKKALDILGKVHAEAVQKGYVGDELESGLLMGVFEINSGRIPEGRSRLQALRKTARAKNFLLIARKAKASLEGARQQF